MACEWVIASGWKENHTGWHQVLRSLSAQRTTEKQHANFHVHGMEAIPLPSLLTAGLERCGQSLQTFQMLWYIIWPEHNQGSLSSFGHVTLMLQQGTRPKNPHVERSDQNSFGLFNKSILQALATQVVLSLQQELILIGLAYRDSSPTSWPMSLWKRFLGTSSLELRLRKTHSLLIKGSDQKMISGGSKLNTP